MHMRLQVAALRAQLEEREEEREDVVAHLAAVHSMLDPSTLRDSPRPNSSVLSKLEDALTPRKGGGGGGGSDVSDRSLEYACTVMGGSDMAGSVAAPGYSTRRGKLEQLRRDVEQHHNRLAEENERLQAEAEAAEVRIERVHGSIGCGFKVALKRKSRSRETALFQKLTVMTLRLRLPHER